MERSRFRKKKTNVAEESKQINDHGLPQVFVEAVTDKSISRLSMGNDDVICDDFVEREEDVDTGTPGHP